MVGKLDGVITPNDYMANGHDGSSMADYGLELTCASVNSEQSRRNLRVHVNQFVRFTGFKTSQQLLETDHKFSAIFAQNDRMAAGAIRTLRDAGFQVPEDYSMIGYDNGPLATLIDPTLTTIQQPLEDFGIQATQILIQAIQQKNTKPIDYCSTPELIIRQSAANYHK